MLQRVIYGVLYYGKDVLMLFGGAETVCYAALGGTVIAFFAFLGNILLRRAPKTSVDIACVLNKNLTRERGFREVSKALFFLSLLAVGIDVYTPPSPFTRYEMVLGYCALFFALKQTLSGILLLITQVKNGRLAFRYRLSKLLEERRNRVRLETERAQIRAAEKGEELPASKVFSAQQKAEETCNPPQGALPVPCTAVGVGESTQGETCDISREGVTELLARAQKLPLSETDSLRYKKIELAVWDALSVENPPKETVSSLISALLKLYAKYQGVA